MKEYDKYHLLLLQLLRDELWQSEPKDYDLTVDECNRVLHLAMEQSLLGPVLTTLIRCNVKMGLQNVTKAMGVLKRLKITNDALNKEVVALAEVLNKNDIPYVVFKGQTVGMNYPNPDLRAPGDIDFYITPEYYDRADKILQERFGYTKSEIDKLDKHNSFRHGGVVFEMHFQMETFGSRKHQRYYDAMMEESISAKRGSMDFHGTKLLVLEPTLNVIQVFKHLFYHMLGEGVGLRQFCDLAMIIHKEKDNIDKRQLENHLRNIGYYKAFLATGAMLVKHLGLPREEFPFVIPDSYEKWADKILDTVMKRGNFGRFNRKYKKEGLRRKIETAGISSGHWMRFFPLAKRDILNLIPKRIGITLGLYKTKD